MTNNIYDKGDAVRLKAVFTVEDVPTNPQSIVLTVKDPNNALSTYTNAAFQLTVDSTGTYHRDISVDIVGAWFYRYVGTGTCQAAAEDAFEVRGSEF